MNERRRYEALNGLRTFACIGVIMVHVMANTQNSLAGFFYERVIPSFSLYLYVFMVISGFGMCCGYYDKVISNSISFTDFYLKRYKKILPFFALLCFIDLAYSPSIESFYEVFANLTLWFGLIPNADINVIGVGWFLGVVFVFYMVFPFYCFLLSNKVRALGAFIVSFIMNILCHVYFRVDRHSFIYCFVYFIAGGLIFLYRDKLTKNKVIKWIALASFILSVVLFYTLSGYYLIVNVVLCTSLIIFAINLSGTNLLNNSITKMVGGLSFEIYLCHMFVFRLLDKMHFLELVKNDVFNYYIDVAIVFIGALAFAFVCQRTLNIIISFIDKRLSGEVE